MGLTLGFAAWARRTVPPGRPSDVARYMRARRVDYSREYWRRVMNGEIKEVNLETWARICDATGVPLHVFFDYQPEPDAIPSARRVTQRAPRPATPAAPAPAGPPNPHDYFEVNQ